MKTLKSLLFIFSGKVIGFHDAWFAERMFPIDMAGFAVNVEFLKQKQNASMPFLAGWEEDLFLQSLELKLDEIEPLANDCTEVLVWHTKTESSEIPQIKANLNIKNSNLDALLNNLIFKGMISFNVTNTEELYICFNGQKCKTQYP